MEIRISLSEEDFRQLVAGKVVEKPVEPPLSLMHSTVKIALQDIGWKQICNSVADAMLEARGPEGWTIWPQ